MKIKYFTSFAGIAVALFLLAAHMTWADTSAQLLPLKKELRAAPAVEMPAKAAQLVSHAKADEREKTAENVVAAAFIVRPVALVAVVAAIARDNPAVAPAAAAQAAALQPKQAAVIARAAAGAAPSETSKIVAAICKVVPAEYIRVVAGVVQAVPTANREQLWLAVTEAVPAVKSTVSGSSSVGATTFFAALPPPVEGPPYWPLPSTNTLTRTNTVAVPPGGGRDYSGP